MKKIYFTSGLCFLFLLFTACTFASTITWTGTTSSSWTDESNWGGTMPVMNDNIFIPTVASGLYPIITTSVLLGIGTITINSNNGSGAGLTISNSGSLITTGQITVLENGTFTMNGVSASLNGINSSGKVDVQGGIITSTGCITVNSGTFNQSGGFIYMSENIEANPTDNLVINGGMVTQTGGTFYVKDFISSAGIFIQTGSSAAFRIYHDWKSFPGHVFNSTAGVVRFSGASSLASSYVNTNSQFNDIVIDASANPGFNNQLNSIIKISGDFTNKNSSLKSNNNVTFIFNGAGHQNITSNSANIFSKLTIDKPGGNVTLVSGITVTGTLIMKSGNIDTGNNLLTLGTSASEQGTITYISGIIITGPSGGFKRWFAKAISSNNLFPVGTLTNNNSIKLSFNAAPATGGSLTAKFVALDPGTSSTIPMNNDGNSVDTYGAVGYWQIDAANGLTGGTYSLFLNGQGSYPTGTEITNYPHLRILKKPVRKDDWTFIFIYNKSK